LWQYNNATNTSDPGNGEAAIWLMNGTTATAEPIIANPGPNWHVITTGDFNGDGDADILWQYNNATNAADPGNGEAAIWLMNGTTATAEPIIANPGPSWHIITTGDFNGDGKSDILWQYDNATNASDPGNGEAAIWLMNGTTATAEPIIANPGPNWHVLSTGDFNGDGKSDILWQNTNGQAAIWEMSGTTPLAEPIIANPGPSWHILNG
jgi:serralysin